MRTIVSVTSYSRRLNTLLPEAVKSVLNQTTKPDLVMVYVSERDYGNIAIDKFKSHIVKFKTVPDYMSYKKYVALTDREFDNDVVWIIDDDLHYGSDNLALFNQTYNDGSLIYAFGVQHLVRSPFFNNPFERNGGIVERDFLAYSGCGVFFPPQVMRFDRNLLETGFRVSPTNDDAFISAYAVSRNISIKNIKTSRRNFSQIPELFTGKTLIDTNIFSFDTQVKKCYDFFGVRLKSESPDI